ncbi:MAG: hypothetical protein ACO1SV_04220 [Fimbriimonas sp.]
MRPLRLRASLLPFFLVAALVGCSGDGTNPTVTPVQSEFAADTDAFRFDLLLDNVGTPADEQGLMILEDKETDEIGWGSISGLRQVGDTVRFVVTNQDDASDRVEFNGTLNGEGLMGTWSDPTVRSGLGANLPGSMQKDPTSSVNTRIGTFKGTIRHYPATGKTTTVVVNVEKIVSLGVFTLVDMSGTMTLTVDGQTTHYNWGGQTDKFWMGNMTTTAGSAEPGVPFRISVYEDGEAFLYWRNRTSKLVKQAGG